MKSLQDKIFNKAFIPGNEHDAFITKGLHCKKNLIFTSVRCENSTSKISNGVTL